MVVGLRSDKPVLLLKRAHSPYPNLFNSEMGIPDRLAKAAGVYHTKGRAAYWDSRNELNEPVASGVCTRSLQAISRRRGRC